MCVFVVSNHTPAYLIYKQVRPLTPEGVCYTASMEIVIGIIIGAGLAVLTKKRKKPEVTADRERKKQLDEELITVVLPTINQDK